MRIHEQRSRRPRALFCSLAWLALALSFLTAPDHKSFGAILSGDIFTHDPSRITKCNGTYYVYCTGPNIPMRYSADMLSWSVGPNVLNGVPDWAKEAVPGNHEKLVWAPDVIFLDGKYYLFYSFSTWGSRTSVIGLVTSPTLDPSSSSYRWTDRGLVIGSNQAADYNAIDPCPVLDRQGALWLSFGSWQDGGIEIVKLDRATGKAISTPHPLAQKARLGPEASFIYFHGGYYYLFDNVGTCCQGMNSTYHIVMGRSRDITGPYLDRDGKNMRDAGGTLFLSSDGVKFGPGCLGIFQEGGIERCTYHYYDALSNGRPTMALETVIWRADGWPLVGADLPPGRFTIAARTNGLALSVPGGDSKDGSAVYAARLRQRAAQLWNVSPTGDGYYSISSLENGKFVTLDQAAAGSGADVVQMPWSNKDGQKWIVEHTSDGAYRIVSKADSSALTAPAGPSSGDLPVHESAWQGAAGQEWLFAGE